MKVNKITLKQIRDQFPSLKRKIKDRSIAFFDGPGGTQMPARVIRAISNYYRYYNSNTHGQFHTSIQTDHIIFAARKSIAALLGAEGPQTISIGQNMTSLNFSLSRGFSRMFGKGDEVVITQLDHEANRGPWLTLREFGVVIREVKLDADGTLDEEDLIGKVNENTRLIAIGYASNALGTVNNIALARKLAYQFGAWLLVDAVHYIPHFTVDVRALGIDLLLCSSYKFYGPHIGFLYAKPGILDSIPVDRLRTQEQHAPYRLETGTLNHASLAGVNAAIAFIASIGEGRSFREKILSGVERINTREQELARKLYRELSEIEKIKIIGPSFNTKQRAPTISFTHQEKHPDHVCEIFADQGIAAWDGHFYALKAMEVLGLMETGGVTRLGLSMYNDENDVDRVKEVAKKL